jgi:alanine racemase
LNNWIEISAPRLAANFRVLQQSAGAATEILAVIKANAYGHGALACAPILVRAGARWLGVTCAAEGARVRAALEAETLNADILIMCGFLAEDAAAIAAHNLVPVVWTEEHLRRLDGTAARVHLEIDTGMGRQGVAPGAELARMLARIAGSTLKLDGFFTHFRSSEQASSALTAEQQRRFEEAVAQLRESGLRPAWLHAGNSSSVDNPAPPGGWLAGLAAGVGALAMVRTGLALFGYCLPIDGAAPSRIREELQPVMTWRAAILATRTLAAGDTVGYNATFTAERPMQVALLGAGYADGLRRELSWPRGWVMLNGRRCAVLGRISMNLTVIDITQIAEPGAAAILLGDGMTADDHAGLADTIAYEILCGIHPCG